METKPEGDLLDEIQGAAGMIGKNKRKGMEPDASNG